MIQHHPDNNMLLEYASGSLNWAHSLIVSAHLQLCPKCATQMKLLNRIGGVLLENTAPATESTEDSDQAFARLMGKIEATKKQTVFPPEQVAAKSVAAPAEKRFASPDPVFSDLPPVVTKLMRGNPALKWRRLSKGLREARLKTGQACHEVAFHRIAPGNKVAEHDHRGKEITMVLFGSFSDADGVYSLGDFLVREPGEVHRPTATQDQECLCLSVVEAPVALTGFLGKLVNPFLSIKPQ